MFHKYEWVFQAILFIGILYTAYIVGYAIYVISLGE
jgi:hypothetical protein